MNQAQLVFDIKSYWHAGTGRGSGSQYDALSHRDSRGLPALPGRTVKGLLRDAVQRAETLAWLPAGSTRQLFGWRIDPTDHSAATLSPADGPRNGVLRVSDASLPDAVAAYLASGEGRRLLPGLYRDHFSTRIDHASGVAKDRSLRGMEVVVPLTLTAALGIVPGGEEPADWLDAIDQALPLLREIGSHRNRGFGRAIVALERS